MQLSNKIALISGAQQGIGAAIALEIVRYIPDTACVRRLGDETVRGVGVDAIDKFLQRFAFQKGGGFMRALCFDKHDQIVLGCMHPPPTLR